MRARIAAVIAWARGTRLGRVWSRYTAARGPLLSQGLAYQSIFAAFAALWLAFAVVGLVVRGDSPLRESIVDTIASAVPGLIDRGDGGAIDLDALLSAQILGWTGAIAAAGLLWTAIGWTGAARGGVRAMLGGVERPANPLLLKLEDLGLAVGFGAAVIVSSAISLFGTSLLGAGLRLVGVEAASPLAEAATRGLALLVGLALDAGVLWALYRWLAAAPPPRRALGQGVLLGALGLGVLKALGGALLGGAASNPLLASFAVVIGLLIWFNLVCMVLLLAAAWIAEAADPGAPQAGAGVGASG